MCCWPHPFGAQLCRVKCRAVSCVLRLPRPCSAPAVLPSRCSLAASAPDVLPMPPPARPAPRLCSRHCGEPALARRQPQQQPAGRGQQRARRRRAGGGRRLAAGRAPRPRLALCARGQHGAHPQRRLWGGATQPQQVGGRRQQNNCVPEMLSHLVTILFHVGPLSVACQQRCPPGPVGAWLHGLAAGSWVAWLACVACMLGVLQLGREKEGPLGERSCGCRLVFAGPSAWHVPSRAHRL